jgi:hypothetical protein
MTPKIEYQLMLDEELNEGNKYYGIKSIIEEYQEARLPEVIFPERVVVNKKLTDFLRGKPYEFNFLTDNTGLDSKHEGIVKILLI